MLGAERRELLLTRLATRGAVVAKEVAAEWGLSEDTVRRDLRELAAAGLCQRVYGGALPAAPAAGDHAVRSGLEPDSKRRVAARAALLVEPGSTVVLDGGTTSLALVAALPADLVCTVVTHSPTVAVALVDHPGVEVLLLGGRLFKHSVVACGAAAVEATLAVSADVFFLGVTGVHPTEGLTTGDADEAAMKRALARRCAETWVLGSVEKIGAASRHRVLPLDAVTGLVTDAPDSATLEALTDGGLTVLRA